MMRSTVNWSSATRRALFALTLTAALAVSASAAVTNYTVTSLLDSNPTLPGELRSAVIAADADGTDSIITFTVTGTIVLNPLNGPMVLAAEPRTWVQGPGAALLEINANGISQAFVLLTSGNCISDLAIYNAAQDQILIQGVTAQTNWVRGCYLGLNMLGAPAGMNLNGVRISGGTAQYNLVGTDGAPMGGAGGTPGYCLEPAGFPNIDGVGAAIDALERNIISNNSNAGAVVEISAQGNRIAGNFIGTDVSGVASIPNGNGVTLQGGALNNVVGVSDAAVQAPTPINYLGGGEADEWNLISGNSTNGVLCDAIAESWVCGNLIGTDLTGSALLAGGPNLSNVLNGVRVTNSCLANWIGTDGDASADAGLPMAGGEQNVISGSVTANGVLVDAGSSLTYIGGNHIGVDIAGITPLPNAANGVEIAAVNNVVGTDADGTSDLIEQNVISANLGNGVAISADANVVWGNIIGLDLSASSAVPNAFDGVLISGAGQCSVGVDLAGLGGFLTPPEGTALPPQPNTISGNGVNGVSLSGVGATLNIIAANWIGTNAALAGSLGNLSHGVLCDTGANANVIDGSSGANFIWNNGADGVRNDGATTIQNTITLNSITGNTGLGIENINSGNTEETPPTISNVSYVGNTVSGTSVAEDSSVVEVFTDPADEGQSLIGSATVTGGAWSATVSWPSGPGPWYVTADVTDTSGNTSEFTQSAVQIPVELSVFCTD
jgi:hypothetical protein